MSSQWSGAAVSVAVGIGVVIGWVTRDRFGHLFVWSRRRIRSSEFDSSDNAAPTEAASDLFDRSDNQSSSSQSEYKMVIVVRTDLKMGKGKAAAQCAHGALASAEKAVYEDKDAFYAWKNCGQPKVVVKTDTEQSLMLLSRSAAAAGLIYSIIRDAGRTQIVSGSKTVLAVGPGPADLIDHVTGHLKLY